MLDSTSVGLPEIRQAVTALCSRAGSNLRISVLAVLVVQEVSTVVGQHPPAYTLCTSALSLSLSLSVSLSLSRSHLSVAANEPFHPGSHVSQLARGAWCSEDEEASSSATDVYNVGIL
jgi:hypothetical protein